MIINNFIIASWAYFQHHLREVEKAEFPTTTATLKKGKQQKVGSGSSDQTV